MIISLNISDPKIAVQILALQKVSYLFEAKLIQFDKLPPLLETIEDLMTSDEIFLGFMEGSDLAGIISYKTYETILDIHRLAVHPKFFRKGIASNLLDFVLASKNIPSVQVTTGTKNTPAIELYLKKGFTPTKSFVVEESLSLTEFIKSNKL